MEEINLEKKLNENIIEKLRSSVQDLRSFIELDAEIKESNLKEIENMNILDDGIREIRKDMIRRTRKSLEFQENNIWLTLENQLSFLKDCFENDDKLICDQQKHIKEQQTLIEAQCKVITDLVDISKQQQTEILKKIEKEIKTNKVNND